MWKQFSLFLLFFGTILMIPGDYASAQTSQGSGVNNSLRQLTIPGFEQIYFVDQLSLELIETGNPPQGFVNDGYILGPNDLVSVSLTGITPVVARGLVVNSQGTIYLPVAGQVKIGGLNFSEASRVLEDAYANHFNDFEIQMTIDRPRQVTVHIAGDLETPGTYLIPAGTTVDTILRSLEFKKSPNEKISGDTQNRQRNQTANPLTERISVLGKPTEDNNENEAREPGKIDSQISLRNLKIIRADSSIKSADIIRYHSTGDIKYNPFIYDGDRILINKKNDDTPRISISGAVQRPDEFEYREDDTIEDLLEIGGGYTQRADENYILVYRPSGERITVNPDNYNNFALQPNDRVVIPTLDRKRETAGAWVIGEAVTPGNFPIDEESTSVADLLEKAGGLKAGALPNAAYIIRNNEVLSDVSSPSTINIEELKRTSDQLRQGFEYLQLQEELDADTKVFVDLTDTENLQSIRILDGDRLYIPRDQQVVVLFGQVNNPGNYPYNTENSVIDYIEKAGGMSLAADQERVFVIKAGNKAWLEPDKTELESGDMIFVDRIPFDELDAKRNYEVQLRSAKRQDRQILLAAISTIAAVVTTAVVVVRR